MKMKTHAIVIVLCFIKVAQSTVENVSCNYFSDWTGSDPHVNIWGTDAAEAGEVCHFNVRDTQSHWKLTERFSCGTNKRRIVMCEKAFDLFKKVST